MNSVYNFTENNTEINNRNEDSFYNNVSDFTMGESNTKETENFNTIPGESQNFENTSNEDNEDSVTNESEERASVEESDLQTSQKINETDADQNESAGVTDNFSNQIYGYGENPSFTEGLKDNSINISEDTDNSNYLDSSFDQFADTYDEDSLIPTNKKEREINSFKDNYETLNLYKVLYVYKKGKNSHNVDKNEIANKLDKDVAKKFNIGVERDLTDDIANQNYIDKVDAVNTAIEEDSTDDAFEEDSNDDVTTNGNIEAEKDLTDDIANQNYIDKVDAVNNAIEEDSTDDVATKFNIGVERDLIDDIADQNYIDKVDAVNNAIEEDSTDDAFEEDSADDAFEEDSADDAFEEDSTDDTFEEDSTDDTFEEDSTDDVIEEDSTDDAIKEDSTDDAIKEDSTDDAIKEDSTDDIDNKKLTNNVDEKENDFNDFKNNFNEVVDEEFIAPYRNYLESKENKKIPSSLYETDQDNNSNDEYSNNKELNNNIASDEDYNENVLSKNVLKESSNSKNSTAESKTSDDENNINNLKQKSDFEKQLYDSSVLFEPMIPGIDSSNNQNTVDEESDKLFENTNTKMVIKKLNSSRKNTRDKKLNKAKNESWNPYLHNDLKSDFSYNFRDNNQLGRQDNNLGLAGQTSDNYFSLFVIFFSISVFLAAVVGGFLGIKIFKKCCSKNQNDEEKANLIENEQLQ